MIAPPVPTTNPPYTDKLNFDGLTSKDAEAVRLAIARSENFHGYIPADSLKFIVRNYPVLAALGHLEAPWLDAYVHASHFSEFGVDVLKAVFDACDRDRLRALKPLGERFLHTKSGRLTLFRGCAGPEHRMGMSWTPSLDKAIWYAAHHVAYYDLADPAVYVATVAVADIYCRLDHYDDDFIVYVPDAWPVAVPASEFRLDRPR
jgi:hypothetical protein